MSDTETNDKTNEPVEEVIENGTVANGAADEVEDMEAEDVEQEAAKEEREEKEDKEDEEEEEEEEDEEEGEPKKGLYDMPVEMSGKRERKKTDRLSSSAPTPKKEIAFEGRGTKLGDIPFIEHKIRVTHSEELISLYRVCFGRPGVAMTRKKDLRNFNGYSFSKDDSKAVEAKKLSIDRLFAGDLKAVCIILGLHQTGTKKDVVDKLYDFLVEPEDTGRKPPKPKKKKRSSKKNKKSTPAKKDANSKRSTSQTEEESDESGSEEGSDDDAEKSSQSEDEKPKKTPAKKTSAKTPAKKTPAKKPAPKKTPAKKTPAKRAKIVVSDDDSSDDEPLIKKTAKAPEPPTEADLKQTVEKILEGANLEEVTMKKVCQQVYDKFPDFDLAHKKDFIKETVKAIIS